MILSHNKSYYQQITISHLYTLSPRKKNLLLNSKGIKIYAQQKYIKNYHHF